MPSYAITSLAPGITDDGAVTRSGGSATFTAYRDGAGTTGDSTQLIIQLAASATSNQFSRLDRSVMTFDTSVAGGAAVSSAKLVLNATSNTAGLGTLSLEVVAATPASDSDIVAADYTQLGATSFASASPPASGEFEVPLNAAGVASINTSGITRLGLRSGWDLNNSQPTWGSGASSRLLLDASVDGATAPRLVIVTLVAPTNTVSPKITSSANVGFTTSVDTGLWDSSPSSYSYQWRLETSASSGVYADVGGATTNSYLIVSGDAGKRLYCRVTATNGTGSTAADSNITPALEAMPVNIQEQF